MRKTLKNSKKKTIVISMLTCLVCGLFLSFLLQGTTNYNYGQVNRNDLEDKLQISSSNPPEQQWNTTWGGNGNEGVSGIALDSSNNTYLIGGIDKSSSPLPKYDIILIKFNSLGQQVWNKTWGGSENDAGHAIAIDSSGNIFIAGSTSSFGAGGSDIVLMNYNSLGVLQWNKTWGGSENDAGNAIALDSSGNIFIAGDTNSFGAGVGDIVLMKYNSLGVLQWNTTWGGSTNEIGYGIALDSSGNIYITGITYIYGVDAGGRDIVLIKFNSMGVQQWTKTWGGINREDGFAVALDSSGNIFIAGSTNSFGVGETDIVLVKYDNLGQQQWDTTWGGSNHDNGYKIASDFSDNIFIVGSTSSFGAGEADIVLIKYNNMGVQQWNTTWGGSGNDGGHAIAIDSSGNIFIAGSTGNFSAGGRDIVLIKYSESSGGESSGGESPIPGYNLFLLFVGICMISVIVIKNRDKFTIHQ